MTAIEAQWEALCEDPRFQDLPYKVETNRFQQIIMSPASTWHSDFQGEISYLLKALLPHGRVLTEPAIQTADGIKAPDVAWISKDRFAPHRRASNLPLAPEICVEVVSPSNRDNELRAKRALYFECGAGEVWLCDDEGRMTFYSDTSESAMPSSLLCPEFPLTLPLD
jgi:Uma2 family endonuclease